MKEVAQAQPQPTSLLLQPRGQSHWSEHSQHKISGNNWHCEEAPLSSNAPGKARLATLGDNRGKLLDSGSCPKGARQAFPSAPPAPWRTLRPACPTALLLQRTPHALPWGDSAEPSSCPPHPHLTPMWQATVRAGDSGHPGCHPRQLSSTVMAVPVGPVLPPAVMEAMEDKGMFAPCPQSCIAPEPPQQVSST